MGGFDGFEPMSRGEGQMAARIVRIRRELQDEFLSLTCSACHRVPVPLDALCECGGQERLDREAFRALQHDAGPAYVALLDEMSRAVRVALIRLGVERASIEGG